MKRLRRKPLLIGIAVVGLVLITAFLAGPRVEIGTTIHPVILPPDLDQYLKDSEGAFKDLIPGTEKTIIWADKPGESTPFAVVSLHGFSASRQEAAPLADRVATAMGANLFYTRFSGHGRGGEAMLAGSVNAWLNDSYEAVEIGRRLGERIVVIGVSSGGTAATWLATQPFADRISALILISPNYAPAERNASLLLWPWGRHIAEQVVGPEYSWEPQNEDHAAYWTHRYPTRALLPMMGLTSHTKSMDLAAITIPTLVIYSPADRVVSVPAIESTFAQIGATRKKLLAYSDAEDPNQHVLAGDILSPSSTDELARIIVDFVRGDE